MKFITGICYVGLGIGYFFTATLLNFLVQILIERSITVDGTLVGYIGMAIGAIFVRGVTYALVPRSHAQY